MGTTRESRLRARNVLAWVVAAACAAACASLAPALIRPAPSSAGGAPSARVPASPSAIAAAALWSRSAASDPSGLLRRFETHLAAAPDLNYPELVERLGIDRQKDAPLAFDPTRVQYFDLISKKLVLTDAERRLFRSQALVSVDFQRHLDMADAYATIYELDLPVLITTDSILHAFHRSFDATLEELERTLFFDTVEATLAHAGQSLVAMADKLGEPELRTSAADVDLYFTVARNLLAGAGASADEPPLEPSEGGSPSSTDSARGSGTTPAMGALAVIPKLARENDVRQMLAKISALEMEKLGTKCSVLYGGHRCIDYSQFRPRGHYAQDPKLRRYFRAMMWLGRVDLGWNLRQVDPASSIVSHVDRERRDAALAVLSLRESGELERLRAVADIIDFMVGQSDDVSIEELSAALDRASVKQATQLANTSVLEAVDTALDSLGARAQLIRSQVLNSDPDSKEPTALPMVFQIFGQRFALDSFVLSRVVYDSIVYQGKKQLRQMPRGLDVMAALGDDEAVRLLEPDLTGYHYASQLFAARRSADEYTPEQWNQSAYGSWLSALRTLHDGPRPGTHFPAAMRREPWRRKQLQTALASWAELRHDTILYAKQSDSAGILCEYPAGFVEPYPRFYAQMRDLARALSERLAKADVSHADPQRAGGLLAVRDRQVAFFGAFADTQQKLLALAEKELAARPFSAEDRQFVKSTVVIHDSVGCGGGRSFSGWYPALIYGEPNLYQPTIADVHTDPTSGEILEVGTGDTNLVIVAVDNEADRAAYVGPVYSYYELTSSTRLDDSEWKRALDAQHMPSRPDWTKSFRAPPRVH